MGLGGDEDSGGILSDLKPFNKKGFLATTLGKNKPPKIKPPPPPPDAEKAAQLAAAKRRKMAMAKQGVEKTELAGKPVAVSDPYSGTTPQAGL